MDQEKYKENLISFRAFIDNGTFTINQKEILLRLFDYYFPEVVPEQAKIGEVWGGEKYNSFLIIDKERMLCLNLDETYTPILPLVMMPKKFKKLASSLEEYYKMKFDLEVVDNGSGNEG